MKSFSLGAALNPYSSIRMNCCDSPWLIAILGLCFAKDTPFHHWYFISDFVIIVNVSSVFVLIATISQWLPVCSNFLPVSHKQNVKKHVLSKNGCTWWGFKYCVIGRAHCPCSVVKKNIDIIGGNWLAISISAVRSICPRTWCTCSNGAFACGVLTVVGLCFIP